MQLAPTPKDTLLRDGPASLVRFRRPDGGQPEAGVPLLLVPSMINRWYVLDLRPGVSLAASLVEAGFDVFCLDWGIPRDEDRYLTWEDVLRRLSRAARRVRKETGAERISVLGYCMGATLTGIHAALEPEGVAALVNLAGPFDFEKGGMLTTMTNPRWFDVDAIADAGNLPPSQMQSGFVALRPTLQVAKWVGLMDRWFEPGFREGFEALDEWSNDNIPFPAEAYRTYIRDLYQGNTLVAGTHRVGGARVDLSRITCPVLTVAADRDTICPLEAAQALNDAVGTDDTELLVVPGGHVGAVVGSKAPQKLYPAIAEWLRRKTWN